MDVVKAPWNASVYSSSTDESVMFSERQSLKGNSVSHVVDLPDYSVYIWTKIKIDLEQGCRPL